MPPSGSSGTWTGADGQPGEYYTHSWATTGTAADEDGYYYTWAAAQNVCPAGWRLPSDQDWQDLEQELGMPEAKLTRGSWSAYTGVGTQLLAGGTSDLMLSLRVSRIKAWYLMRIFGVVLHPTIAN